MTCTRCPSCPGLFRPCSGDGPEPLSALPTSIPRVLFIGSMPGPEEDNPHRQLFSGKAAKEFNETYLRLAGLSRDDIRFTNARKCRNETGKKPSDAEVLSCASYHLPGEIESADPEFIVLMGAAACSLIPDLNLDTEHGIPRYNQEFFGWTGTLIPMDHPSGGMHDTALMIPLLEDFARLREVFDGTYVPAVDCYPNPVYKYVTSTREVHDSIQLQSGSEHEYGVGWPNLAIDMEDHDGIPYSIQWSPEPGKAYMMLLVDVEVESLARILVGHSLPTAYHSSPANLPPMLCAFQECLDNFTKLAIFHNAPGDLDDLSKLRIEITKTSIADTMQLAYHQGNLPQGLKALAYRLLGIRMKSWVEVVGPPSRKAVLSWIEQALEWARENLTIITYQQLKTKVKQVNKPHPIEKRLKGIFRYTCYNDEYPVWEHLDALKDKETDFARVESICGPAPRLGIKNCTHEEALEYGCKDADITGRVYRILKQLQHIPGSLVAESDRDKIAVPPGHRKGGSK